MCDCCLICSVNTALWAHCHGKLYTESDLIFAPKYFPEIAAMPYPETLVAISMT